MISRFFPPLAIAAALMLGVGPASSQESAAIGLTTKLDRAAPVYAVGEGLSLTVRTNQDALVTIWLREPDGKLSRVVPETADGLPVQTKAGVVTRIPKTGSLRITPPTGQYELRISAQAASGGRTIGSADSRLAGDNVRQQQVVPFKVEAR